MWWWWAIVVLLTVTHIFSAAGSDRVEQSKVDVGFKRVPNGSNIPDISTHEIIIGVGGNVSILSTANPKLNGSSRNGNFDQDRRIREGTSQHGVRIGDRRSEKQVKVIHLCTWATIMDPMNNTHIFSHNEQRTWNIPSFALLVEQPESEQQQDSKFGLKDESPFCGISATQLISISQQDEHKQNISDVESIGFLKNGYFKIQTHFYYTDEYCVEVISETKIDLRYCPPKCTRDRPCVNKCFPPGEVMGFHPKRKPISSGEFEFLPKFYDDFPNTNMTPLTQDYLKYLRPHFIEKRPKREFICNSPNLQFSPFDEKIADALSNIVKQNISTTKFRIQVDGRIFFSTLDDYNCPTLTELVPGNFCIDGIRNVGDIGNFTNHENEGVLISCPLPNRNIIVSLLFGVLMIASSFFLLVTFIVYVLLWKQQNIHGWTIMAHTASLFFTYIFLGSTHIIGVKFGHLIKTKFCYVNGVLAHFFFLSTFTWLTLLSFDLWWTFRSIVPTKRTTGTRMLVHLGIGWGFPAIVVIVSVCLDVMIGDACTSLRLPKYGQTVCYIETNAQGVYLYYPAGVTLAVNVVFFCVTIFKLYHYKKNTRVTVKNSNNRQLVGIFTKLFFVMGITWIFEFMSWLHSGTQITWYWVVIDVWNILQAVALFYIYVCKQDVLESLENKYPNSLNKLLSKNPSENRKMSNYDSIAGKRKNTMMDLCVVDILRFIRRATLIEIKGPESSRGKASSSGGGGLDGEEMKTKTSSLPRSI